VLESFLEFAIGSTEIAAAFTELQALGFAAVPPADARGDGYAVVSDGTAYIGIYDQGYYEPCLTFVRPDLEHYVRALRRRGIELELTQLGEQEFHEVAFRDPDGQLVRLVEARTFSPVVEHDGAVSLCGRFLEISLSTRGLADACAFWEGLGLSNVCGGDEPHPWRRLETSGLKLGLHETAAFPSGLSFAAAQLDARIEYLRAKGFRVTPRTPHFSQARSSATIALGSGAMLYLVADPGDAD